MRRPKTSVTALCVALLGGALAVSAARAEPIFKAASYPVKVELSGGAGHFLAGTNEIKCESVAGVGEVTSPGNLGMVELTWKGCTYEGTKCHSDETLTEGGNSREGVVGELRRDQEFHLVLLTAGPLMLLSGELYYVLLLTKLTEDLCGVVLIHTEGRPSNDGGWFSLIDDEENVLIGKASFVAAESEGKQEITSCEEPHELCEVTEPIELASEFVEGKPESLRVSQTATMTFSPEVTTEG